MRKSTTTMNRSVEEGQTKPGMEARDPLQIPPTGTCNENHDAMSAAKASHQELVRALFAGRCNVIASL
jgi:hypothetical protein